MEPRSQGFTDQECKEYDPKLKEMDRDSREWESKTTEYRIQNPGNKAGFQRVKFKIEESYPQKREKESRTKATIY